MGPAAAASCANASAEFQPDTVVALERAALDRWGRGDPQGYIERYAQDVTYFDPMQAKRIDGLAAMQAMLAPIKGKVHVARYEMIGPKVQHFGDVAVLSYNLASYVKPPAGDTVIVRWNSTAVYARRNGEWKIVHSHWSFTKP